MTSLLHLAIIFLSILGIADAGYITYEEFSGVTPVCDVGNFFDCGAVLNSQWAHIGPIPLSLLGVGYYSTMFVLGAILLTVPAWRTRATQAALVFGTTGGIFSLFLMYLQLGVIGAICLYCTVSAFTSGLLWVVSTLLWRRSRKQGREDDDSIDE